MASSALLSSTFLCFFVLLLLAPQDAAFPPPPPPQALSHVQLRLSAPLVGDDGTIYTCYGKNLFAFSSNGSVSWTVFLGYSCNLDSPPVPDGYGKIYLIAEDRVLKVIPSNIWTSESPVEIFYGPGSSFGGAGEILGICISIWSSYIYINVKKRAIFAFSLRGQLVWIGGPMLYRFGYLQGCRKNATDCYFSSAPVIDQCEGVLFVASNQGHVYSIYTRSPNFRWIKDFSSVDNIFSITPGNNGLVYVTFPRISCLMALDVSNGKVLWENKIGPLSSEDFSPAVDSNGWVSIGSLDGFLYSFSPTGVPLKILKATAVDSIIQVGPVPDCSGFAIYVSQTMVEEKTSHVIDGFTYISAMKPIEVVLTLLVPATGSVYWTGKYPGEVSTMFSKSDLRYFHPDEKILLAFVASSGVNKFTPSYTIHQRMMWTCSLAKPEHASIDTSNEEKILMFILFHFVIIVLLAMSIRFCYVFWQKKKLKKLNLDGFLKKRHFLHVKRKACDRMIAELEVKAREEASTSELLDSLGDTIRAKQAIERKLSSTYSLGRDPAPVSKCKSLLPVYGKSKSYSFRSANKESVTIFDTISGSSSSEEGSESDYDTISSSSSRSVDEEACQTSEDIISAARKGKAIVEVPSSSSCESSDSSPSFFVNPLYSSSPYQESSFEEMYGEDGGGRGKSMEEETYHRSTGLKRRTLSSTN